MNEPFDRLLQDKAPTRDDLHGELMIQDRTRILQHTL